MKDGNELFMLQGTRLPRARAILFFMLTNYEFYYMYIYDPDILKYAFMRYIIKAVCVARVVYTVKALRFGCKSFKSCTPAIWQLLLRHASFVFTFL